VRRGGGRGGTVTHCLLGANVHNKELVYSCCLVLTVAVRMLFIGAQYPRGRFTTSWHECLPRRWSGNVPQMVCRRPQPNRWRVYVQFAVAVARCVDYICSLCWNLPVMLCHFCMLVPDVTVTSWWHLCCFSRHHQVTYSRLAWPTPQHLGPSSLVYPSALRAV